MDITTILGIVLGFSLVVLSIGTGGAMSGFINAPSLMIVVGGTVAATLTNYPLKDFLGVVGVVKKTLINKSMDVKELIDLLVKCAEVARKEGVLALERLAGEADDALLRKGIQLIADGTEPEMIRGILSNDIDWVQERHEMGKQIFESMGAYSPALGMIGTLVGLILMLRTMEDPSTIGPSMAVALITTLYGALLANLVFLPLAGKLGVVSKKEILVKEMILQGVLSIQSGDNPIMVRERLHSFLSQKMKESLAGGK
jgi:chemotaxis protein MotA